jgi:hypothetical protein
MTSGPSVWGYNWGHRYWELAFQLGGSPESDIEERGLSPSGIGPENECDVEVHQQLQVTAQSLRKKKRQQSIQTGRSTPRNTGTVTVGRDTTSTLTLTDVACEVTTFFCGVQSLGVE